MRAIASAAVSRRTEVRQQGPLGGAISKFQMEDVTVAAFGSTTDYRDGLSSLGIPRTDNYAGQLADTNFSADSDEEFETSNYGGTRTTPKKEWEFIVNPREGVDYGGGRKPVDLKIFLYATCAKRRVPKTCVSLPPSMVTWMLVPGVAYRSTMLNLEGVRTADGLPHMANGIYHITDQSVNGRPVYENRAANLCMWWCPKASVVGCPPPREGALQAREMSARKDDHGVFKGPYWVVGWEESVGTDWCCLFISSSAGLAEKLVGKDWKNWHVACKGVYTDKNQEQQEGWHWVKHRRFQREITVTAVGESNDSDAVRWMDYKGGLKSVEDRDAVELVVLQRFVTQLNVPILQSALRNRPGTLCLEKYRTDDSVRDLCRRLDEALSDSVSECVCTVPNTNMDSVASVLADVLDRSQLDELIIYGRRLLQGANFREEEVIAIRCYTGPLYMKVNGALMASSNMLPARLFAHLKGNTYINMLSALCSGIIKLASICIIPGDRKVYRGMSGFKLPDCFFIKDARGARGGVHWQFMSCTTDPRVAHDYAKGGLSALVFEIQVGMIDMGADVRFLSQYPAEREILMPPRSNLEVTGEMTVRVEEGEEAMIVPARINCNTRFPTLEQHESQRRNLCLQLVDTLAKEVSLDMDNQALQLEYKARAERDLFNYLTDQLGDVSQPWQKSLMDGIKDEGRAMVRKFEQRSAAWYLRDTALAQAVNEALALPELARTKLNHWMDNPACNFHDITKLSLQEAQREHLMKRRLLLKRARAKGHMDMIRQFALQECVAKGLILDPVSLDAVDKETGESPLATMCANGDVESALLLLEAGANPFVLTSAHEPLTPALHMAAKHGIEVRLLKRLIECKAPVDARDAAGRTALYLAAEWGHSDCLQTLIDSNADANALEGGRAPCYRNGARPLHLAAEKGHADAVKKLIDAGAEVNVHEANGWAPIHGAAREGHKKVLQHLINGGANFNNNLWRDGPGMTPVMLTAWQGHPAAMEVLIGAGADVNARDDRGMAAAHWAAWFGHPACLQCLVAAGADMHVKTGKGITPRGIAQEKIKDADTLAATLAVLGDKQE